MVPLGVVTTRCVQVTRGRRGREGLWYPDEAYPAVDGKDFDGPDERYLAGGGRSDGWTVLSRSGGGGRGWMVRRL